MSEHPDPTWEDTIQALFTAPYWIEAGQRAQIATVWKGCMLGYGFALDSYADVKQWAVTIYDHLYSRTMPLTTNPAEFWPDAAVEQLRLWINQGCRLNKQEPTVASERIPPPHRRPAPLHIRKDILDLTPAELEEYRARLDGLDIGKVDPQAAWQELAYIHTNWCLHYQEAFLLWHRAYLLYFEHLIDFPIPYWNMTSPDATNDGHPASGIPQAFKDETYVHPRTGEVRPNPLRFAVAKDGQSKAIQIKDWSVPPGQGQYVQRDPVLYTEGDDRRQEREEKLNLLQLYQRQIVNALLWPVFSTPQGYPGYPWANIQSFDPPPPDPAYPHRTDFDGLYEQPHDNIHGWLGPDMADNAFTAFDPIFWGHHSNLDRIFESWKREHPTATYSANVPIRPFVGPYAHEVDMSDRREFIYSTIGDLVKDSRALGYDYMSPKHADLLQVEYQEWPEHCYIVFSGVRCTSDTYSIDLFINQADPQTVDATLRNQHYVGQIIRLGMGVDDDKGRCIPNSVTRVIDASYTTYALGLPPSAPVTVSMIVTDMTQRRILSPAEYQQLPGFAPVVAWGASIPALHQVNRAGQQPSESHSSHCHPVE